MGMKNGAKSGLLAIGRKGRLKRAAGELALRNKGNVKIISDTKPRIMAAWRYRIRSLPAIQKRNNFPSLPGFQPRSCRRAIPRSPWQW